MVEIFKYVDKFFTSLTNYLTYNDIFIIFVGLSLFTILCVLVFTSRSYEAILIKAIDKLNVYFIDNPQINEENLVAFNNKMKSKHVPKQLRKYWQQFVLYREAKASAYMSFENCVSNPIKNSSYTRDVKLMGTLNWIFSLCSLILNAYYCFETSDIAAAVRSMVLTPVIILLLNYIVNIFLNLRHSAIVSDLFQNYQYFEVNIDKATETLPEYVDYEVLFDRNEIKKGIPILYAYLQKRAEEEQRELERARLRNVEHEKFNFDDQGVAASLVLERAMQEAENYIAERKKYNQDTQQINDDITQEDINYREITKEYNRQMQVSKETFANFKAQLEEVSSTIEANYLKKQQQQELDRQRNLERDFDTATEKHKKVIESYQAELDTVDQFIAQSRKNLEDAMKSEFSSYSSKVYDEAKKLVEEREKEKFNKLKQNIEDLEEKLVAKNQEIEQVYKNNQSISEQLEELSQIVPENGKKLKKNKNKPTDEGEKPHEIIPEYKPEPINVQENTIQPEPEMESEQEYKPLEYVPLSDEKEVIDDDSQIDEIVDEFNLDKEENNEVDLENHEDEGTGYVPLQYNPMQYEEIDKDEVEDDDEDWIEAFDDEEEYGNFINEEFVKDVDEEVLKTDAEDNSTEKMNDSIDKKPASRRGRPRKVVDAEAKGEKRGRGRPKKVIEDATTIKPKRKAGRPRKEQTAVVEQKKGRGRPKKVETKVEKPVAIKKGRGRPKKVVEVTTQSEPKRKVGRPRKEQTAVVEQKKGRGRPKKVETKIEKPVAIKKGRGRPKKVVEQASSKPAEKKQEKILNEIKDIDAYLKEIDDAIAAENAKLEETQKELAKKAKLRNKK